ncbi:MAG: hypothetical protein OHK0039_41520 [Bacteroidia bacterium]
MSNSTPSITTVLKAGLIAAGVSAAVNLAYHFIYVAATGIALPASIGWPQVLISSILPVMLAGLGYFALLRFVPARARVIFVGVVLGLALLSLGGSFADPLPDGSPAPAGFALWSAPMHIVAGLAAALLIPRRA